MSQQDNSKERFLKKYEAMSYKGGETWRRATWPVYQLDQPGTLEDNPYDANIKYQSVDIVTIQMPEDCFRALVELDEMTDVPPDRFRDRWPADRQPVSHILARVSHEVRVRNQVPAIKKAWDNYQLLLKLHGSQVEQQDYHFRP